MEKYSSTTLVSLLSPQELVKRLTDIWVNVYAINPVTYKSIPKDILFDQDHQDKLISAAMYYVSVYELQNLVEKESRLDRIYQEFPEIKTNGSILPFSEQPFVLACVSLLLGLYPFNHDLTTKEGRSAFANILESGLQVLANNIQQEINNLKDDEQAHQSTGFGDRASKTAEPLVGYRWDWKAIKGQLVVHEAHKALLYVDGEAGPRTPTDANFVMVQQLNKDAKNKYGHVYRIFKRYDPSKDSVESRTGNVEYALKRQIVKLERSNTTKEITEERIERKVAVTRAEVYIHKKISEQYDKWLYDVHYPINICRLLDYSLYYKRKLTEDKSGILSTDLVTDLIISFEEGSLLDEIRNNPDRYFTEFNELASLFIQIFVPLHQLYVLLDFCHLDLHPRNIMCTRLGSKFIKAYKEKKKGKPDFLKYTMSNKLLLVPLYRPQLENTLIYKLIDFGISYLPSTPLVNYADLQNETYLRTRKRVKTTAEEGELEKFLAVPTSILYANQEDHEKKSAAQLKQINKAKILEAREKEMESLLAKFKAVEEYRKKHPNLENELRLEKIQLDLQVREPEKRFEELTKFLQNTPVKIDGTSDALRNFVVRELDTTKIKLQAIRDRLNEIEITRQELLKPIITPEERLAQIKEQQRQEDREKLTVIHLDERLALEASQLSKEEAETSSRQKKKLQEKHAKELAELEQSQRQEMDELNVYPLAALRIPEATPPPQDMEEVTQTQHHTSYLIYHQLKEFALRLLQEIIYAVDLNAKKTHEGLKASDVNPRVWILMHFLIPDIWTNPTAKKIAEELAGILRELSSDDSLPPDDFNAKYTEVITKRMVKLVDVLQPYVPDKANEGKTIPQILLNLRYNQQPLFESFIASVDKLTYTLPPVIEMDVPKYSTLMRTIMKQANVFLLPSQVNGFGKLVVTADKEKNVFQVRRLPDFVVLHTCDSYKGCTDFATTYHPN